MAYTGSRNGWLGIGLPFRGKPEFVYVGLEDSIENRRITKTRAKGITHKMAAGTFDFAREFPNATGHLKRRGLLPQAVRVRPTLGESCLDLRKCCPARSLERTPAVAYDYGLVIKG